MHFKVIVTLLLFTIHTAIEARFRLFRSTIYSVAIKGRLTCPDYKNGFALVMISYNKKPELDKHPIAKHYAKFNLPFFLSKMFRHKGRQPRLFVKIFHRCKTNKDIYERMYLREIPSSYVIRGASKNAYDLGVIVLSDDGFKTKTRVGIIYDDKSLKSFNEN